MTQAQARVLILAVEGDDREEIQTLLAEAARRLGACGARVLGVIEHMPPGIGHHEVMLRDLSSGAMHRLHQDLGPGAAGCSLDPAGLAAASGGVEQAIGDLLSAGGDVAGAVVVLSKFGRQEAEGRGLTGAFHAAVAADIPVLTSVSPTVRAQWADFAGDLAILAPATLDAVDAWWTGTDEAPAGDVAASA